MATRAGIFGVPEPKLASGGRIDLGTSRAPFVNVLRIHDEKLWLCTDRGLIVRDLVAITPLVEQSRARQPGRIASQATSNPQFRDSSVLDDVPASAVFDVAFNRDEIWIATEDGLLVESGVLTAAQPIQIAPGKSRSTIHRLRIRTRSAVTANADLRRPPRQTTVNLGYFGPLGDSEESFNGVSMLRGAQLAVDGANARIAKSKHTSTAPTTIMGMAENGSTSYCWGSMVTFYPVMRH